jgi:hypothetical protein
MMSDSRSATYTNRVPGKSAACSTTRSYPSIQRVLSLHAATYAIGVLALTRPHPGIQHTQRFTLRRERVGRISVHAALRFILQRPQPGDLLSVEVQFGRVILAQHHIAYPHPLG